MRIVSTIAEAKTRPEKTLVGRFLRYCATLIFSPLLVSVVVFSSFLAFSSPAHAATNTTINFQARILLSSGALVPDGDYHLEFKIYDDPSVGGQAQGTCSVNCLWVETRTGGDVVRVVNGYVSVNLGAVDAFPVTMPWDQELYVTMRVGGNAGAPSWDTEMVNLSTGRMKVNSVPYAFRAAQAFNVFSDPTSTASTNTDAIAIQTGNALGATSNSGSISIDSGTATGTSGALLFGTTNASALTLGRVGITTTLQGSVSVAGGTNYGIYYRDGSTNLATTGAGVTGQCLVATTANAPSWSSCSGVATTLQSAYDISTNPEVVVDATRGALTVRDNATPIGANLFEVQNNAGGTNYFAVTASGISTSGSLQVSGLTTLNGGLTLEAGDTLTFNGDTITDLTGTGLTLSGSSLAVSYGSAAGTAVQGNVSLTCPSGLGNLSGGGTSITLGSGGTCGDISITNSPTFTTSVTSPIFTGTGAVALSSGGANTLTIDAGGAAGVTIAGSLASSLALGRTGAQTTINGSSIVLGASVVRRTAAGTTSFEFNDTSDTTVSFTNTDGTAVVDMIIEGGLNAASFSGNGSGLTSLNASNIASGTIGDSYLSSNVVVLSGTQTLSGLKTFGAGLTVTIGQNLTVNGDAFTDLTGTGLTLSGSSLAVSYGSVAGTTVQGNVTLACPSGSGNLSGGGDTITLGVGGTCSNISISNSPTFTTSVTSPTFTGTGGVTLSSGGGGNLSLTSSSGTIVLGANNISRTAAGTTSIDLVDGSNTSLSITNSGAGQANLSADGTVTGANGLIASAGGVNATGNSQILGETLLKTTSDSVNAVQIRNSDNDSILRVDTTGDNQNNVITNDSFETGITGWTAKGTTPTTFAQDTAQYYDGLASLRVTTQATPNQGAKYDISGGLSLSARYSLSFYIRLDPTSATMATLAAGYSSDGSTDNTACTLNTSTVSSSGWTRINCSFTTPAGFSGTPFVYIKQTDGVVHTFYIDGVLLQTDTNTETNFRNGKIALQGTIVSPVIIQNTTNSTNALAIQNSAGTNVFVVDTTDQNTMITNPGFEAGVVGWTAQAGTTTVQRDTAQSWLGAASLQVNTSNTANTGAKFTTGNVQPTQLALSTNYTLSWYAKLSSGAFTDIKGRYSPDGGTTFVECTPTNQVVLTTGWTRYSCTFNSGATAVTPTAFIAIVQTAAPGAARTFWVDGVQLEAGSVATEYGAGSIFINGTFTAPATFKNKDNSTTAFSIQNSSSTVLFQADTINNRLQVGNSTTDATAVLFVLDSYNNATDPAGTNGAMYYNSADNRNRCYENSTWSDCTSMRILGETTLGAANATISITLSANVEYLHCRIDTKGQTAAAGAYLRFNNASGAADYQWNTYSIIAAAIADAQDASDSEMQLTGAEADADPTSADVKITNFANVVKTVDWSSAVSEPVGVNNNRYSGAGVYYNNTTQISSVQFVTSASTFLAGSHAWCEGRNVR